LPFLVKEEEKESENSSDLVGEDEKQEVEIASTTPDSEVDVLATTFAPEIDAVTKTLPPNDAITASLPSEFDVDTTTLASDIDLLDDFELTTISKVQSTFVTQQNEFTKTQQTPVNGIENEEGSGTGTGIAGISNEKPSDTSDKNEVFSKDLNIQISLNNEEVTGGNDEESQKRLKEILKKKLEAIVNNELEMRKEQKNKLENTEPLNTTQDTLVATSQGNFPIYS